MTLPPIPWVYLEIARFLGCCFAAGAVVGLAVGLVAEATLQPAT